jgi:crossover junction endodeoxyribonuclease RuvC
MILGIDPGIRKLWYAIISSDAQIHDAGILVFTDTPTDRAGQYKRMTEIKNYFKDLLESYPIKKVCMEKYFFTQYNQANAEFVYGARGILLSLALEKDCDIREFTPQEIKKRVTGNAKAGKMLVQKMVMKLYKLQDIPKYHDAADALGLAWLGRK